MTSYGLLIQRVPEHLPAYHFMVKDETLLAGPVVAFTWRGIRFRDKSVQGYRYDPKQRRWRLGRFPIPDVILNRSYKPSLVGSRLWKMRPRRLFNSHLWISKWTTWQALRHIPELQKSLPPTYRLDFGHLRKLLQEHGSLYLKPHLRTHGMGIIKVWRSAKGYVYRYKRGSAIVTRQVNRYPALVAGIKGVMLHDPYLVQKDIRPAMLGLCRFDFRVFCVRQPDGHWVVTGSFARVAPGQAIATNRDHAARDIHLAGTMEVLTRVFGFGKAQSIWAEIIETSIAVCKGMAGWYKHMAVFGLDIGVDEAGRVWLFEANAHPQVTQIPGSEALAKAIWNYAKSL